MANALDISKSRAKLKMGPALLESKIRIIKKALAENEKNYKKAMSPIGMIKEILSFKNGGVVPKTGIYKLHKGETVVPAKSKLARMIDQRHSNMKH